MTLIADPLRHLVEQHGAFLRHEALAFGVDDNALRRWLRTGLLIRVRHGSYTFRDTWEAMTPEEQHVVRGRVALRRVHGAALSHATAALAYGMDVWRVDLTRVHLTRTDGGAGHAHNDLVHHEGFLAPADLRQVSGVDVVCPERAALETALLAGAEPGLVTVSSGLRLGLYSHDALARQHAAMSHWPEARPLQVVTRLACGDHESPGEVRSDYLFWAQGLPRPIPQFEVRDAQGRLLARCDFAWPAARVVVEFDGAVKYERLLRPGETASDVVIREKQREDALRAAGWTVLRITWADLSRPYETAQRIRAALRQAA